ncbi:LysR family transcriptional regulator [Paenibacillus sp. UNC499MF]|uniref:LysR family transcriptional regulator n=1 Tax=Paenibacillus sp. UNC499MF TaxID=1502751 RepID=UPI00089FCB28|nr:LysR family transcriptional regulator [Paenibacillus sp. UNC499MF]SEG08228.1 DNA-binding transcriptional regulator, LysR family [Paenibacillus sp. UNC499MF]
MEILQLQYFRTVARLQHMTKAAEELHIAQPALSKTIARLENDLGVPLFDRQGRKITLNAFGRAFLNKAEVALTALEEGRKEVADLAGMEQGSISIASPVLNRLSGPLGEFLARYPDIRLRLTQVPTEDLAGMLEKGEADFCFTAYPVARPGIVEEPVLSEEVFLAVPPGHRFADRTSIALREAAGEPFIGYKKEHVFRQRDDALFRQAGMTPDFVCEVNEPSAKAALVRAGLGVAFVGACNRSEEPPTALMVRIPISEPACSSSYQLAWHEKRYLSKAAQKFRDFIRYYFSTGNDTET